MKARIRKNQKDWHVYIFWILLGVFALLVIMDAFSEDKFDRLPLILCFLPLTILQLRPYQITDRDMLHGNGQIDVKLISRLECSGNKVVVYYSRMEGGIESNTISRENVKRKIVISANVADRDLRSVVNDIQERVDASVKLPEGYHIEYGGQFESEQAASRTLALTSFMSIVVIFLLLYHEFRSVKESAIILINLPLALIGGVFALLITTGEVSIPAIIGFISLFGIATRNGMLLISHYNHLQQEEGYGVYDSVIRGSLDRLNPILMTALSSALALIPLALSGDLPGNEIQSPMAKVILGGLLTSTFLNGFIIPIVYLMMHGKKEEMHP